MTINSQDGNSTGLSLAKESAVIGVLGGSPVWQAFEPNSYSNFGGPPTLVARSIIGTRKRKRGNITGIAPKAGYNLDFTGSNLADPLQSFMFALAHEKATTRPLNTAQVPITSVATADESYNAGSGLGSFLAGSLILASGFGTAANNGLKTGVTVAAGKVTVAENLVNEASPPTAARIEVVGFQFASGDAVMTYTGGVMTLTSTAKDMTQFGLNAGEWVYIGGDIAASKFATATLKGYARLASAPTATAMVFDKFTGTAAADAGAAKTIHLFLGVFYCDAVTDTRTTYTQERKLGNDGVGIQSELIPGSVANELTLNVPKKDKMTADLSFIGLNATQRTGTDGLSAGTRVAAPGEQHFNTSSDVWRLRISTFDPTVLAPTGFGYITQGSIKINNNASLNEAVGVVGGFDVQAGDFEIGGNAEFYFTTTAAITAIRAVTTCTMDMIVAHSNTGWIWDLPYVQLGEGEAKIEKNKAIMLPVNMNAVESDAGYCIGAMRFPYLPTLAMPVGNAQV